MTSKKSLIKIICVIFLMIFSIGLVGGFIGSIAKKGDTDDVLNSEEPKEEPVFIDKSDVLLLNHEYNTSSGVVTVVSETSDFYISDTGNEWILLPEDEHGDGLNMLHIKSPLHSSGQYSLSFEIDLYSLWSSGGLAYSLTPDFSDDEYSDEFFIVGFNNDNDDDLPLSANEDISLKFICNIDFDSCKMYFSVYSYALDDSLENIEYNFGGLPGDSLNLFFFIYDELSCEYITFSNFSYTKGFSVDPYLVDENGV